MAYQPPLSGIRVISLAEQYPGPFATMLLADLGADVVLVERPGSGDPSRRFPGLFASLNRNKRSVVINLKTPEGHAEFLALLDTADVLVEGYRPGVMKRLNLDADTLRAHKPDLIYASISAFGQTGPLANLGGHDLSIQAAAGVIDVPAGKEADAAIPRLPLGDISSAMYAALGIVSALHARSQSGQGATIDVSMFDSLVSWMTPFIVPLMNGLPVRPLPPQDPGYGVFATADGQQITLSIAGEDHMWKSLCDLLKLPEFADLSEQERIDQEPVITARLRQVIGTSRFHELCTALEERRIAFGPVNTVEDISKNAHVIERGLVVKADNCSDGAQYFVRQPLLFHDMQTHIRNGVPKLGEHTDEVLSDITQLKI